MRPQCRAAAPRRWIVARVVVENDLLNDGKPKPASAYKRRIVRDRNGSPVIDPDTGKPVRRVIRPGWQAVIADLKTGRASAVLAEDLDRACRDPRDLEDLLDAAELRRASARSLSGSLTLTDGGTDAEKLTARIMVATANKSSADTSRRCKDAKERLSGQSYQGGLRPYGYVHAQDAEKYHKTLLVVPDEAEVLRAAAADILDRDLSLHAAVRGLRARGVPTVRGGPWTTTKLRQVLLKPAIAGLATRDGQLRPAPWDAILDRDVWEKLKAHLEKPVRTVTTGNEPRWLLSGIALCGVCQAVPSTIHATGTKARGGSSYACDAWHVRRNARHADDRISALIVNRLSQPDAADLLRPPPAPAGVNAPRLRAEARALRARKVSQMKLHAAGAIDDDDLATGMREIQDRLKVIEAQLAQTDQPDPLAEFRDRPAGAVWASLPLARKRAIVRLLMTVTLMPTNRRGPGFDPDALRVIPLA
jgi:site-specific DNA recombinase